VADVAGQSIFDVLASDHRDLEELIARATAEPGNDGLRELLVMELVRHFVAEEQYLYPLVRERGAAGDRLADEAFTMHRQCEDTLRGLEHDETDEVRVAATLAEVAGQLRTHVRAQEPDLFQQLAAGPPPTWPSWGPMCSAPSSWRRPDRAHSPRSPRRSTRCRAL